MRTTVLVFAWLCLAVAVVNLVFFVLVLEPASLMAAIWCAGVSAFCFYAARAVQR